MILIIALSKLTVQLLFSVSSTAGGQGEIKKPFPKEITIIHTCVSKNNTIMALIKLLKL